MFFWIPYAFIRIVVFFIAGILIGIYYPESIPLVHAVMLFFSSLAIYFLAVYFSRFAKAKMVNPGFAGLLAVLIAGYINVHLKTESGYHDHFAKVGGEPAYYKAVVTSYATERNKTWRMEVRVTAVKRDSAWQTSTGMVMLYLSKTDFTEPFGYGDMLLVKGRPQPVSAPSNPGEFDYQKFLSYKNIHHQHFLRDGNVTCIGSAPDNPVMKLAIGARTWADSTLRKFVSGEREQAIASALVLGITDGLDNDLLNAYAATGAMHVLAVSGLHISIIYLIIVTLFKPLNKSVSGRWTLAAVSLLILWIYAFITGLSPSVLRAVTMFSFVALAKPWKQKVNIYNTLGASAFFLLLFDPYMIMSVGFQLSYLAVLGIVYIQPKMYLLWEPKHRFMDEIWKVTTVSIAAQIATLPLGLLYFNQFPNYFLLANLLVIPGSFVVLVGGLAMLAFSFWSLLAGLLGWIVTLTIKALNFVVFTIEGFPYSQVNNIFVTPLQAILLAAVLISVLLLIRQRKFYYLVVASLLVMTLVISQWHYFIKQDQPKLMVYNVANHSAIDFIDGGVAAFAGDSALIRDEKKIGFHIQGARLINQVHSTVTAEGVHILRTVPGGRITRWQNTTILILENETDFYPAIKVDCLIISNNAVRNLGDVLKHIAADTIILDSSNSFYSASRLQREAEQLNVTLHSVRHVGFFQKIIAS